jgi:hypothetical protein
LDEEKVSDQFKMVLNILETVLWITYTNVLLI